MDLSLVLNILLFGGRLLVGAMLVLAGVLKLKAGSQWFLRQILAYDLVKGKTAFLLAKGLPWAEILCGFLLMIGFLSPLVSLMSFILLWGFTATVVSTFLRDRPADCGCFGRNTNSQTKRVRWTVVYRNLGLMGTLLIISIADVNPLSIDVWSNGWFYRSDLASAIWGVLTVIWSCSLVLALILQRIVQKRLHLDHKLHLAMLSTPQSK
jgi:uncharacterized membrane protein YphA (DoxX/SURF4 family)